MLLMVAKGIRGEICHAIHRYAKANNKYITENDRNKKSFYPKYWNVKWINQTRVYSLKIKLWFVRKAVSYIIKSAN